MPTITTEAATLAGLRHAVIGSAIGELTLVGDGDGLTGLYFPGHWTRPDRALFGPRVESVEGGSLFDETARQLHEYLAGRRRSFDVPLALRGSDRARQVWQLLSDIPYGQTTSYRALAAELGDGTGPRGVGWFVAHNPVSIIVGCHRVLGSTGKLTGYAGGLGRKRYLLELEQSLPVRPPVLW
jgi:methylated-DNA-[protein]-cysteine S-methyltransferase